MTPLWNARRFCLCVGVLAIVAGVWGALWLGPRLVRRELVLILPPLPGGTVASVRWNGIDGNGAWVLGDSAAGGEVRQRLPAYPVRSIEVLTEPPRDVTLTSATITRRFGPWEFEPHRLAASPTPSGCLLGGDPGGTGDRVLGVVVAILGAMAGLTAWIVISFPGWARARKAATPLAVVLGVAVVARVWVRSWCPMVYDHDSIEYLVLAKRLLADGGLAGFDGWRPPGYPALLAAWTWVFGEDWRFLGWLQSGFGLVVVAAVYATARRVMPIGPAAAVGLLVGLDPWLLTTETLVMSEAAAAMLVALVAWAVVVLLDDSRTPDGWRWWGLALVVGVLGGVAALVRGNLLVVPVAAIGVLGAKAIALRLRGEGPWRRVLAAGIVVGAASGAVVGPWVVRNGLREGVWGVVVGESRADADALATARLLDANQTRVFTHAQAASVVPRERRGDLSLDSVFSDALDLAQPGTPGEKAAARERRRGEFLREMFSRRAPETIGVRLRAFLAHLGVLKEEEVRGVSSMHEVSRVLRGDLASRTNGPEAIRARMRSEVSPAASDRNLVDPSRLRGDWNAGAFADWFAGWRTLRRVLGTLALVAVAAANVRGPWSARGAAVVVLASAGGVGLYAASGIDRLGLPVAPLVVLLAVWLVVPASAKTTPRGAGPAAAETT